jgi:hypothetical protein
MKILILVLSSELHPYGKMIETSRKTWDSVEVEGVETVFYCGQSEKVSDDKVIYLPIIDCFETMTAKTLMAFNWALANKDFDYVVRVNSSCYVNKSKLVEYVKTKPKEKVFCGLIAGSMYGVDYLWGGGQFIISRDVVKLAVENWDNINNTFTEDVAISDLIVRAGIKMDGTGCLTAVHKHPDKYVCHYYDRGKGGGMEFTDINEIKKLENQFFFRVKQDGAREVDEFVMNELFRVL